MKKIEDWPLYYPCNATLREFLGASLSEACPSELLDVKKN